MSMGGASTAQPLDISGALQWNPAAISVFDDKILNFDLGLFFSSPELSSSYGPMSGVTEDDRGVSPMPAFAMVWGKEDSKHTFGVSAFGISGFGVTFPENMSNPINMPQPNGFGHIESDYMLLQIGLTWAYELSDNFSIGIEPTINYGALEMEPNPLAMPDFPVNLGGGGNMVFGDWELKYDNPSSTLLYGQENQDGFLYVKVHKASGGSFNSSYTIDFYTGPSLDTITFNMVLLWRPKTYDSQRKC